MANSLGPVLLCESSKCNKVHHQQCKVKASVQEDPLWQEPPVDSPLKQELTLELKGSGEIAQGVGQ